MTQIHHACSSMTTMNMPQNSMTDDKYGAKLMDDKYSVK
jgi:hypothetical protein